MGSSIKAFFGTLISLVSLKVSGNPEVTFLTEQWECRPKASSKLRTNNVLEEPTLPRLDASVSSEEAMKELIRTGAVQLNGDTGEFEFHPNITKVLQDKGFVFDVTVTKGSRCERCGNVQNPPK